MSLIKTTRDQVLAILETAKGAGLIPDLTSRDMAYVDLEEVDFDGAILDGASLDGASLVGAILDGASLDGASLVGARLDGAILDGASLVGARLVGASLDGASLVGASLEKAFVLGLASMPWTASVSPTTMQLGCQIHPHDVWEALTDKQIADMATGALAFWKTWKPILMPLCKAAREWLIVVKPPAQEGAETVRIPLDTWYGGYQGHYIRWTESDAFMSAAMVKLVDGAWKGSYWAKNGPGPKDYGWFDAPAADQPGITACMLAVEDAARAAGVVLPGAGSVAVPEGAGEAVA